MPTLALTGGPYRFLRIPMRNGTTTEELFDAGDDSGELENVIETRPEVADHLRAQIDVLMENAETPWKESPPPLEMDEIQLNQLRALGYAVP